MPLPSGVSASGPPSKYGMFSGTTIEGAVAYLKDQLADAAQFRGSLRLTSALSLSNTVRLGSSSDALAAAEQALNETV
jgi:hypothetical protein